jgi:hypothetical protein
MTKPKANKALTAPRLYKQLVYQLIDDGDGGTLRITNAENS